MAVDGLSMVPLGMVTIGGVIIVEVGLTMLGMMLSRFRCRLRLTISSQGHLRLREAGVAIKCIRGRVAGVIRGGIGSVACFLGSF